jgi:hypothetical protein
MKNKKLITVIIVLAIITIFLGYLNMRGMDTTAKDDGTVTFVSGEDAVKLSFEEITALSAYEFKAVEDTSSSGPASRKFRGVLLKDALNKASYSDEIIGKASKVLVKGLDGYVVALAVDEVLSGDSVYLAFEKDGKPLGNMKRGGSGPFQMIARSDSFSQRWCKYVTEVKLE